MEVSLPILLPYFSKENQLVSLGKVCVLVLNFSVLIHESRKVRIKYPIIEFIGLKGF